MNLARAISLSRCIVIAVWILFGGSVAIADSNTEANRLFVEAVKTWKSLSSSDLNPSERLSRIQSVKDGLNKIVDEHPGSDLAVQLVIGQNVGPLSLPYVERLAKNMEHCAADPENSPFCPGNAASSTSAGSVVRVIAAKMTLPKGTRLTEEDLSGNLKFLDWPASAVPTGAFLDVEDLFGADRDVVWILDEEIKAGNLLFRHRMHVAGVEDAQKGVGFPLNPLIDPKIGDILSVLWVANSDGSNSWKTLIKAAKVIQVSKTQVFLDLRAQDQKRLELANTIGRVLVTRPLQD